MTGSVEGLDHANEVAAESRAASLWQAVSALIGKVRRERPTVERLTIEAQLNSWRLMQEAKPGRWRQGSHGIERRCTRCRKWFPATSVHFGPLKTAPDGMMYYCRGCMRVAQGRPRERIRRERP